MDQTELMEQCQRYYANILTPFSPLVTAKIKEVLGFNLPVSMVATSHGIVWRDDPTQIILKYLEWADHYQEDRITLFYDSMSNNTRMMADAIAQGIHEVDPGVAVKIYNVARHDKNEILTQVFRSKGVLVGSSTMNNVMMPKVAGMLEEITGLRFRNKRASAFGSYGWTGGAVDRIQTRLMDAGFDISISLKAKWRPDGSALALCREHGRQLARQWALHPLEAPCPIITTSAAAAPVVEAGVVVEMSVPASAGVVEVGVPAFSGAMELPVSRGVAPTTCEQDDDQPMLCTVCQWIYDPALGEPDQLVAPGTPWARVPDSFLCPGCGIGKEVFEPCAVEACV
ncbi:putative anaerobic nitric oxide reductase flavorubredoxin [Aeromonas salmonicida subsp. masoucida NBRC 13784]|nr:putative anaerobic nitric oxide reductase flavorubredoxin [Aeromonas salmonicida subsp. masoucida NBRC 13784]